MSSPVLRTVLNLLIAIASYAGAASLAAYFSGSVVATALNRSTVALAAAILTFWIATEFQSVEDEPNPTVLFVEHATFATGSNLVIQALLGYLFEANLLPLSVVIGGGLAGSVLVWVARREAPARAPIGDSDLLVGYGGACSELIPALGGRTVGVLGVDPFTAAVLPGPLLGSPEEIEDVVARVHPSRIVLHSRDWTRIPAGKLLRLRFTGVQLDDTGALYEKTLGRVCREDLNRSDLLFAPALKAGRHIMAIQAIYTDLIGLLFLVLLSPILVLTAIAVVLFCGSGPIIESVECLGFQYVPYRLLRFRTRSRRTGRLTLAGGLIARLHLANLPQLINIVRGEVVFFGPRPIRDEFAHELMRLIPYYCHLFSVKPGVLGWAQCNLPRYEVAPEWLRLEYDFYYIKHGSLALDLQILIRTVLGWLRPSAVGTAV